MLAKDTTLLESTERSQIMRSKHKEIPPEKDMDYWPSKKAKGKQLVRYCRDIEVKMEGTNYCEKCVHIRQNCLVHNSR